MNKYEIIFLINIVLMIPVNIWSIRKYLKINKLLKEATLDKAIEYINLQYKLAITTIVVNLVVSSLFILIIVMI
jgi:hypothetical protein